MLVQHICKELYTTEGLMSSDYLVGKMWALLLMNPCQIALQSQNVSSAWPTMVLFGSYVHEDPTACRASIYPRLFRSGQIFSSL